MNATLMHQKIDKSFYGDLPEVVTEKLDSLIDSYSNEEWFIHAWNEYRDYVFMTNFEELRMPGYIFNKYTGKEISHCYVSDEMEDDELYHYGIKRRSGRYPWGSGDNPYQRSEDFYIKVNELRDEGISDKEIVKALGLENTTQLRFFYNKSKDDLRRDKIAYIKSAQKDGKSNVQIGIELGEKYNPDHSPIGESTVRSLLDSDREARMNQSMKAAQNLKKLCDEKGILDVGKGTEHQLGISREKMDYALMALENEYGYEVFKSKMPQVTNKGQYTTIKVLAKPGTEHKEVYKWDDIKQIEDVTSDDGGDTLRKSFMYPASMDSKRLKIRYEEDGGKERDGLVLIRKGVKDLSLGESNYAQVRILVDGKYYIKGMAAYGKDEEFPEGVDVIFNSNKSKEGGMEKALKEIKDDPNNPFGSAIKQGVGPHGGQSYYIDDDGKEKLSLINKRSDEADWGSWSKETPSQFLSKQPLSLINRQLNLATELKQSELDDIRKVSNPTVRKQLLTEYADKCDRAAIDLKGAPLSGQKYQVILPIPSLKDDECYAPNYEDGQELALIRYPHGGTFEIPIVKVNNRNKEGKSVITPDGKDAVGINMHVAERLSGADFDGDTVMVIPLSEKVRVKSTDPLPGLVGFDPKVEYGPDDKQTWKEKGPNGKDITHYVRNGVEYPLMHNTQTEMGIISNLITDMTIKGATDEEKARAVKHSMVVIDAEKHHLDYRQSEIDNGIKELHKKYQGRINPETGRYTQGASTLISSAKSTKIIPERTEGIYVALDTGAVLTKIDENKKLYLDEKTGRVYRQEEKRTRTIDPETGEKLWRNTGSYRLEVKYKDANGKTQHTRVYEKDDGFWYKDKTSKEWKKVTDEKIEPKENTEGIEKMAYYKDANDLVSDWHSSQELAYAKYANKMKALANEARKEEYFTKDVPYSPSANKIYKEEVDSLSEKLKEAEMNAPRERHAQMIANMQVKAWLQDNPHVSEEQEMKQRNTLLVMAREAVGAKRQEIRISDKEFEAIQAGAISPSKLRNILAHSDKERLKQLATPRADKNTISRAQLSRMKHMSSLGYTNEEVAKALGVNVNTVIKYLSGKEN